MKRSPVAALVRGWVDLYTRGMPAAVRAARRDEVADDLWCQHQDAADVGRSPASLSSELLLRLVLGMPADVTWRLAQSRHATTSGLERSSSMSVRVFGTLAMLAGVTWTTMAVFYLIYGLSAWTGATAPFMVAFVVGGGLAFAATAFGLLWRYQEQLRIPGVYGGVAAGLGAVAGAFDGAWATMLLPLGSAVLVWDLARIGVLSGWMAMLHGLSAIAILVPLTGAFIDSPETGLSLMALFIPYPLSWIAIGASLLRGVPPAHQHAQGA